jgi:hypothetical protein
VQDEREALRGFQCLQDHQQGQPHRVGEQHLLLGVDPLQGADQRVGDIGVQRLLAARGTRTQHVQADPADHRGQPAREVPDLAGVRAAELQPHLLDRVVRLAQRAEHPVGHRPKATAVLLEPVR